MNHEMKMRENHVCKAFDATFSNLQKVYCIGVFGTSNFEGIGRKRGVMASLTFLGRSSGKESTSQELEAIG